MALSRSSGASHTFASATPSARRKNATVPGSAAAARSASSVNSAQSGQRVAPAASTTAVCTWKLVSSVRRTGRIQCSSVWPSCPGDQRDGIRPSPLQLSASPERFRRGLRPFWEGGHDRLQVVVGEQPLVVERSSRHSLPNLKRRSRRVRPARKRRAKAA